VAPRRQRIGRALVVVAAAAGLLHAVASAYWALGGRALLSTVGAEAAGLAGRSAVPAGVLLGTIALVKAAAALVPVAVAWDRIAHRGFWRIVSAVGGGFLVLYGGANVLVGGAVLLGWVRPEGGADRPALAGHVLLWDPLFLVWGLALVTSLVLTRRRVAASDRR
jgi:hypothetical protein